ncbi:hypothetical protein HC02_23530 [Vibrio parahaemolyticus]|nr:hypothetical protein HC02_23530 [Vibrio parahaemolyticus]
MRIENKNAELSAVFLYLDFEQRSRVFFGYQVFIILPKFLVSKQCWFGYKKAPLVERGFLKSSA